MGEAGGQVWQSVFLVGGIGNALQCKVEWLNEVNMPVMNKKKKERDTDIINYARQHM